jgi:integrase
MKSTSKKRTPSIVNLTVKRRYLSQREIERLMDCARKHGRYGHRDATMILVAYRHGLRASEVCDLQWQQIELSEGRLHVHRVKNGIPSVHPIRGDEMRALRKLRRDYPTDAHVFVSERGAQQARHPKAVGSSQDRLRPLGAPTYSGKGKVGYKRPREENSEVQYLRL